MKIELRSVPFSLVETEIPSEPPRILAQEYEQRAQALYERAGADWVVVYGDREHCANLLYLTGYDPRFEEALFVLGPAQERYLIVGNEGLAYAAAQSPHVPAVLCQSFSLMGQARSTAPRLADVLRELGVMRGQRIAVVGWKYLEPSETDDPVAPAFVPAYIVNVLRGVVADQAAVTDATALLMHPEHGLRAVMNSPAQIAAFEWSAMRASAMVSRIVHGARPGMTEYEAAALARYAGEPLSAHIMCVAGRNDIVGLSSPSARRIQYGDGITTAIGIWGGLSCRAGLMLGWVDQDFFTRVVTPYFRAVASWWQALRVGVTGAELFEAATTAFGDAPFNSALNPGHLVSYDEWVHTPIRPGSPERVASGMVLQADIIPAPLASGQALNCEDTCAVADAGLREALRTHFPEVWLRILRRREFMREQLGIVLDESVLPLSIAPAWLPPFWLRADEVCALAS
ncbi:MAG: M24 family metallopeptidase [Anaerolineae bacterium]|nr:aminopeptidase P family N-terminal domain-containing protein [Thermoflexales bacterium]MDW8407402.1 M24 family metallopeptidase [Anaerolineae bacterium]